MPLQHLTQQAMKAHLLLSSYLRKTKMATSPIKAYFLFLIAISSTLSAHLKSTPWCIFQPSFEVKAGYFFFSQPKMRKIYDKNGLDIQLCASYPFWDLTCKCSLHAYGAVEYFHRS